jgi:hypothetical protein
MSAENEATLPPGSLPGEGNSDRDVETLTITKRELDELIGKKLKGSGKELKRANEELAVLKKAAEEREAADEAARRKKLEEDGQKDELLKLERDEKAKISDELEVLKKREAERQEKIAARNKGRIKNLPDGVKDLVPEQLSGDDLSDYLDRLESKIVNKTIPVAGFGGARANGAPVDPMERAKQAGHDFLFGQKKGNQR